MTWQYMTYLWVLLVYVMLEVCKFSEAVWTLGQLRLFVPDSLPLCRRLNVLLLLILVRLPDLRIAPCGIIDSLCLLRGAFLHFLSHPCGIFIIPLFHHVAFLSHLICVSVLSMWNVLYKLSFRSNEARIVFFWWATGIFSNDAGLWTPTWTGRTFFVPRQLSPCSCCWHWLLLWSQIPSSHWSLEMTVLDLIGPECKQGKMKLFPELWNSIDRSYYVMLICCVCYVCAIALFGDCSNKHCFKQPFLLDIYLFMIFQFLIILESAKHVSCWVSIFRMVAKTWMLQFNKCACNYPANYIVP